MSIAQRNITPHQQIRDIREEELLVGSLTRLEKKYAMYKTETNQPRDEISLMLEERDSTIRELRSEIELLNQRLVDLSVAYNMKIEEQKTEHKQELHRLHAEFVKRTNK
ncbi:hypothetical protein YASMINEVIRUS_967 [Yasminevirus sp. GU-2018]|uniref:Uncharacterized protein n=1 Tax=Yasminevirus sp. GU-2018 TaxID=2420051 RepID=A0A5K0UAK7_9VIRU|nr:hypothetical protein YASMINEVIRUS_967 [Yasminevirus sp. GU-2018]